MKTDSLLSAVCALALLLTGCSKTWHKEQGLVFGTYYSVSYKASESYYDEIQQAFAEINHSLSTFDAASVISQINKASTSMLTDSLFRVVYAKACEVSDMTGGAFDITVAPLVNAWGFGYDPQDNHQDAVIDSIRQFVGYEKIQLQGDMLYKADPRVKLDCSAIAKGYACDRVAEVLERHGVENYIIDIGGELRMAGQSPQRQKWRIGVNKAVDDPTQTNYEVQAVLSMTDCGVATSGNYRQFYQEGDRRIAHTIDPRTGYPTQHNVLSVTIFAKDCMTADAFATACMVLGDTAIFRRLADEAKLLVYAIYADENGEHQDWEYEGRVSTK